MSNPGLEIWVVYDNPTDFPGLFIARKWVGETPTQELLQAETLEQLRAKLPQGLVRLDRHSGDDAKIVETWL